jgi:DNA repair protein RadA/Sms
MLRLAAEGSRGGVVVRPKIKFVCTECGTESPKWMGRCPGCQAWNTMVEEIAAPTGGSGGFGRDRERSREPPRSIAQLEGNREPRFSTGLGELDRVLGGGLVPGSLLLVGGDPGIGKSTLLLQMSHALALRELTVLYVSGEESAGQVKLRADRLGTLAPRLFVQCETNLDLVEEAVESVRPDFLVIDSIQTVYGPDIPSAPGSVSQVRECTGRLLRLAKGRNMATVLVGHVTKEGSIAGPRLLEHMVDTVLYFEGDRHHTYRVLRAIKNRFGPTNEIGVFEMADGGLREVANPSELFLSERPLGVAGSCVAASLEGSRPLLVELQALVAPTHFPSPRRMTAGWDHNRLALVIAVLEKRMGFFFQNHDAYLNVAGGARLVEPAADLAAAVCLASSFKDVPARPYDVVFGEVGLTGEVRAVARAEQRVKEARKLGFKRVILPAGSMKGWRPPPGIELIGVHTVADALRAALDQG